MSRRRIREDNLGRCPGCGGWMYRDICRICLAITTDTRENR